MTSFGAGGNGLGAGSAGAGNLFGAGLSSAGGAGKAGTRSGPRAIEVKLDKLFEKPPPANVVAEAALLGAMILDHGVIHEIIPIIKSPDTFSSEAHGAIYAALVKTFDQKQAGNLVLLSEELSSSQLLEPVGGVIYLEKLASETPGPAAAVHFARIVADKAKLRKLIRAGGQIVFDAYNVGELGAESAREVIDRAEQLVFAIAEQEETSDAQPLSVLVEQEYNRLVALQGKGATSGLATGYPDLDELTSGLQEGELLILAARPSMGKTAFMLNLAEQIGRGGVAPEKSSRQHVPVGVFSLEMSKASIAQRLLSARSGYSSHDMRSGRLSESDYDRVCEAMYELGELPIYVDDTPGLSVLGLRTRARRLVSQYGCKLLMIDYLQLMSAPNSSKDGRQNEVAAISRGIKALARELNVPIVCLSQLNRGPESRGDNRPRMSDLRESGSIEQDADVVMLLHREAYYHVGDKAWEEENQDKLNLTELIIAKQRNGPTDVVKLTWDNRVTRFRSYARHPGGNGLPPAFSVSGPGSGGGPRAGGGGGGGGAVTGGGWGPTSAPDPFRVEVQTFAPGRKTGPIANHRDGGGPDRDDGGSGAGRGSEPPPFDADGGRDDDGLPI
jgi:replicative DNA helicase